MKHLRRAGTSIVVALFSVSLLTVSASAATDDDGAQAAKKSNSPAASGFRKDTSWGP